MNDMGKKLSSASPGQTVPPASEGTAEDQWRRQARRLMDIAEDANRGWPELAKRNPKLAAKFRADQQAIADCRRRAATNRRLLDMRLD